MAFYSYNVPTFKQNTIVKLTSDIDLDFIPRNQEVLNSRSTELHHQIRYTVTIIVTNRRWLWKSWNLAIQHNRRDIDVSHIIAWRRLKSRENPPDVLTVKDRIDVERPKWKKRIYKGSGRWWRASTDG